jgi:phospholipid/cholesterol/gamma-HCH transport system substrate-binding protein
MKRHAQETWVGLFMTVGLLAVAYLAIHLGDVSLFDTGTYPLEARFSAVSSLQIGNPVTMRGIDIGEVTGIRLDQERRQAVVRFRVDDGVRIYSDAMAAIRTRGLIGEQFLEIDAGGAGERLKAGDTIVETEAPVNLVEIIGKYAFGAMEEGP